MLSLHRPLFLRLHSSAPTCCHSPLTQCPNHASIQRPDGAIVVLTGGDDKVALRDDIHRVDGVLVGLPVRTLQSGEGGGRGRGTQGADWVAPSGFHFHTGSGVTDGSVTDGQGGAKPSGQTQSCQATAAAPAAAASSQTIPPHNGEAHHPDSPPLHTRTPPQTMHDMPPDCSCRGHRRCPTL